MTGKIKMVKLSDGYEVFTKTVGVGIPILLLHGGPGANHLCFEIMEQYIDLEKYSLVYYDQLGSLNSDKVEDVSGLTIQRYIDDIETVREALGLDKFFLLGHSWGSMIGMEYSLQYGKDKHLLGSVLCNMTASIKSATDYIEKIRCEYLTKEEYDYVLDIEEKEMHEDERYVSIIFGKLYTQYFCRLEDWPDFLKTSGPALDIYNHFQGNNEFVVTGVMSDWNFWDKLQNIEVKSLVIGSKFGTMSAEEHEEMARRIPDAECVICPNGGHFAIWDDAEYFHKHLIEYLDEVVL